MSSTWRSSLIVSEADAGGVEADDAPRVNETLRDGGVLLVLIPIDYVWFPLSERGAFTYAHSSGLQRGETWRFVPRAEPSGTWPTEYAAALAEPIVWQEVEKLYGVEAARRARIDARSLQVRVRRP